MNLLKFLMPFVFAVGALAQGLPVVNGNAANGRPGQYQTVSTGGMLVWSNVPTSGSGTIQTNISYLAVTNAPWITNSDTRMLSLTGAVVRALMAGGKSTNLTIYPDVTSTPPDALIFGQTAVNQANQMLFINDSTNYAIIGADPAAGVFLGNGDLSRYILLDPVTGAFSWSGIATGNGNLITGDDEAYGAGWNGDTTLPTKNAVLYSTNQ